MNKSEHAPEDVKSFYSGANPDKEKEFLGAENNGEYIDARNQRPVSIDGNSGASEKIEGETVVYPSSNLGPNYVCIGSQVVNGRQVEYWASTTPLVDDPAIRIDGNVVVKSPNLTFLVNSPLQMDKNESCQEGEVFLTDNNSVPLIFNIKDILDSFAASSQKYFADFNILLYQINLSTPVDIPVFVELVNIGGGGGLPVGEYAYSIRYVTSSGDRTNFSNQTPLIPVFQNVSLTGGIYPAVRTRGSDGNVLVKTSYGVKIRFRVTNLLNYDSIEIRRYAWDSNSGVGFLPSPKVIGRVAISHGEISVREFIDPQDANLDLTIPDDEDTNQLFYIEKAKSIRYFDKRLVLMNYKTDDNEMSATFEQIGGKTMFPIVHKMGKMGHSDPYNHTYYKHYTSGERYGFAINAFDGVGNKGFALPIPGFTNYQFPNRRQEIVGGSPEETYSYNGAVTAANINSVVSKTFEVFDLVNATRKEDICSFKNISQDRKGLLATGGRIKSVLTKDCSTHPSINGGKPSTDPETAASIYLGPYTPYTPVKQSGSTSGHGYRVNTYVKNGSGEQSYNPEGFSPNYFAKGIALAGVSNLPSWVKAFTIARTKKAGRVICQGLGMYSLNPADFDLVGNKSLATKEANKMWFFSQDIISGLVHQSLIDDIQANPNNYSVQFISPLGFFSELYNFERAQGSGRDRLNDLAVYARVLKDNGTINVTESGVGVSNYVAYNKYRNPDAPGGGVFSGSDGDKLIGINDFQTKSEGRGSYFEITFSQNVYNTTGTGGTGHNDFNNAGLKSWHEPFYIVNIVQNGAEITDKNVDSYLNTGAYVKIESIIGEGNGVANQEFILVDERWEDCIPALTSSSSLASNNRFIYLRDSVGNDERWVNITYKTSAQQTTIVNDIIGTGSHTLGSGEVVTGTYSHEISTDQRTFKIVFNITGFNTIPSGTKIIVKYDKNTPIRVFGGDSFIGESVFAPIDKESSGEASERGNQFAFDVGFPFRNYHITPRHYVIADADDLVDRIQDAYTAGVKTFGRLAYIRQMIMMFTAENRIALHTAYSTSYPNQSFPGIHYVMRPNKFDDTEFAKGAFEVYKDNNIYPNYEDDYGDEYLNWKWGGFRFLPQFNHDYSQESPLEFVSKPDFGFAAETEFCTGIIWSLPRAINQQDSPGLKTFQALNTFQISDDQGEIVRAWDATSGKGDNLYAITEKGTCLLLSNKSVLSDLNGSELGVYKGNNFIQAEYWLDKNIGMNDEMWRSSFETSDQRIIGDGTTIETESLYFANKTSVYVLSDNTIRNIGKDGYYSKLRNPLLKTYGGYISVGILAGHVTSFYDKKHELYGLQIEYNSNPNVGNETKEKQLFVYSQTNGKWIGVYDYRFDNYLQKDSRLYGMKNGETYELDKGLQINGSNITYSIDQVCSPEYIRDKEFMNININSTKKPVRIEFYDSDMNLLCAMDQVIQGALYLKQLDGWYQQIPRKNFATRDRIQDRLVIYRIIHNLAESFKLTTVNTQYKIIK